MGDLNINWNEKCPNTLLLKTLMKQFHFEQLVDKETHVTKTSSTCLDHIHMNDRSAKFNCGTFTITASDHCGVYLIKNKFSPKAQSKIIEGQLKKLKVTMVTFSIFRR